MARNHGARSIPGRGRASQRTGTIEFFTRPEANIVLRVLGFLIRYRAEITLISIIVTCAIALRPHLGPDGTLWLIIAIAGVVLIVPVSRRFTIRRGWCVITRHRLRTAFVQTRTMTHDGRMPFLLWSRPSPVGERLRVWLPAGLCVNDLSSVTAELATACWAREARVRVSRAQAALVIVDIIRRDPLSQSRTITPEVIDGLDTDTAGFTDDNVVSLPDRTTLRKPAESTASAATATVQRAPRKAGPAPGPNEHEPPPVAGFGGMDVSDYI